MYYQDLESTVIINPSNELDVQYRIKAIQLFSDILSNAGINIFSDLISVSFLKALGKEDLNSISRIYKAFDLMSKVRLSYVKYLESTVTINEMREMDVIFNLLQPPVNEILTSLIKDSYIREARPTLNYGTAETLVLGHSEEGEYIVVMQFDISNALNLEGKRLVLADLVLNFSSVIDSNIIIDAYELTEDWNEYMITWANFTPPVTAPVFSFNVTNQVQRINILHYILTLIQQGKTTLNLMFKVRNESNFLFYIDSKESPNHDQIPRLELGYQEIGWSGYIDTIDLLSSISVRNRRNRDLYSTVIPRFNEILDLNSTALLAAKSDSDLDGIADLYNQISLDSTADIYTTRVKNANIDAPSKVIVIRSENTDIDSTAYIILVNDLNSTVTIIRTENNDLESSAVLRLTKFTDLESTVEMFNKLDFDANAVVRLEAVKELISTAMLVYGIDLDSQVTVTSPYLFLDSSAIVRRSGELDLQSTSDLYRIVDLNGDAIIRQNDNIDLQSSFIPRITNYLDLEASTEFRSTLNLISNAVVRITDKLDLSMGADIYLKLDLDGSSLIFIPINLESKAIVRRTENIDLFNESKVRQFDIVELDSNLFIKAFENYDLDSYVYIIDGIEILDLPVTIYIVKRGNNDLVSKATIRTNARIWNSKDIFNFEDRRLPRVWNKSSLL